MSVAPSICMIAPHAYDAFAGAADHIGGIESRMAIEARGLARRGHAVSAITWRHEPDHAAEIDGVRMLALCGRDEGTPGLRFVHPRWTGLRRGLERAAADVYYTSSADALLGQMVQWCRSRRRSSLFAVASDSNCVARPSHLAEWRHRTMYRYGLRRADCVVVNTQHQARRLQREFGRESVLVVPGTDGPSDADYVAPAFDPAAPPRVAWVGRFSPEKRMEWLLDLAQARPGIAFDVAGDANEPTPYSEGLWRRARQLPNVHLHGRLPHAEAKALIGASHLVCCSSAYEGFPNTFLEAWSRGVPVVSSVDPDEVIARCGLGAVTAEREGLGRAIDALLGSPRCWRQASERCRRHYLEHHGLDQKLDALESVLRGLVR